MKNSKLSLITLFIACAASSVFAANPGKVAPAPKVDTTHEKGDGTKDTTGTRFNANDTSANRVREMFKEAGLSVSKTVDDELKAKPGTPEFQKALFDARTEFQTKIAAVEQKDVADKASADFNRLMEQNYGTPKTGNAVDVKTAEKIAVLTREELKTGEKTLADGSPNDLADLPAESKTLAQSALGTIFKGPDSAEVREAFKSQKGAKAQLAYFADSVLRFVSDVAGGHSERHGLTKLSPDQSAKVVADFNGMMKNANGRIPTMADMKEFVESNREAHRAVAEKQADIPKNVAANKAAEDSARDRLLAKNPEASERVNRALTALASADVGDIENAKLRESAIRNGLQSVNSLDELEKLAAIYSGKGDQKSSSEAKEGLATLSAIWAKHFEEAGQEGALPRRSPGGG